MYKEVKTAFFHLGRGRNQLSLHWTYFIYMSIDRNSLHCYHLSIIYRIGQRW